MITIYTICFNESLMLPYFIQHYRNNFPDCKIIVYDNGSTDNTAQIAIDAGCEVREHDTNGKLSDKDYLKIKNNCWKTATTDWVLVADCDELLQITEKELTALARRDGTIVDAEGWNMVNKADDLHIAAIDHAVRAKSYDKAYLFNRKHIKEINYGMGCHSCVPHGYINYGNRKFKCFHYKYINLDYMINRHRIFAERLSEENKAKGSGGHYLYTPAEIRTEFFTARHNSIKIK
jgi:glycosyltransferase involved in cell wall biosynthesis